MRHNHLGQLSLFAAALGLAATPALAEQDFEDPNQDQANDQQQVEQGEAGQDDADFEASASGESEGNSEQASADQEPSEDATAEADQPADQAPAFVIRGADPSITMVAELADAFAAHSGHTIALEGGASSDGPAATLTEGVDITFTSQPLTEEQAADGLQQFPFGFDGVAVITHPGATSGNVTTQEMREIFTGQAQNWSDGQPITAYAEQAVFGASGTFQAQVLGGEGFSETVTQANPATIFERVATEPGAIGFVSASALANTDAQFDVVSVEGVALSAESVATQAYPIQRTFTFITRGEPGPEAQAFVEFAQSHRGRQLVADAGFVTGSDADQLQTASVETDQPAE